MNKDNYIFIIFGPCGAGKTTIANKISEQFAIPVLSRDTIKEMMFETLGWTDRVWSEKLGKSSYALLYLFTEKLLQTSSTFVIESNFNFDSLKEKIKELQLRYHFTPVFIRCFAKNEILFSRVIQRDESGERHPGHIYPTNYEEYKNMFIDVEENYLQSNFDITDIKCKWIEVDTTEFSDNVFESLRTDLTKIVKKN